MRWGVVGMSSSSLPKSTSFTAAGEPERSLRLSILEGCSSAVLGALTGEAVLTALLLSFGALDYHIGSMSALGTLSMIGALLGARWVARTGRRKPLVILTSLVARLAPALAAFLPFTPWSSRTRILVMLGLVAASGVLVNMAGNAWVSWMAALVPPVRRGRYFALRNSIVNAVGMLASYGVGHLLALLQAKTPSRPEVFVPFLLASVPFTLFTTWVYTRQWEPEGNRETVEPIHAMFVSAFSIPGFRRLVTFSMCWAAVLGVASPFFLPHMLQHLGFSMREVAMYSILSNGIGLASQPLWGRVADRAGHRPVLLFCMPIVGSLPLWWLIATPNRWWPIWVDALLTGLFWPGLNLAHFNMALDLAPARHRTACLGVRTLLTGVAQAVASLLGGYGAYALDQLPVWTRSGFTNYHVLFLTTAFGRWALIPMARRLPEPRAWPVSALVRFASTAASKLFLDGVAQGWVWLARRPSRPATPKDSEHPPEARRGP